MADVAKDTAKLVASILLCEVVGVSGSMFVVPAVGSWYMTIHKPWFTPPTWAFAPVWATLYLLMGVSLCCLWWRGISGRASKVALALFFVQLALNAAWTYIFFGLVLFFYGLVEIVVLWAAIALTIAFALKVSRTAGIVLIPYIAWVTVALLLNYYIWVLNI